MHIQPVNDFILVEVDKEAEKTASGIVLAKGDGDRTEAIAIKGRIVRLPEEWDKNTNFSLKVNDMVLVIRWEAHKTSLDGKQYVIVKEKDILAKLQ